MQSSRRRSLQRHRLSLPTVAVVVGPYSTSCVLDVYREQVGRLTVTPSPHRHRHDGQRPVCEVREGARLRPARRGEDAAVAGARRHGRAARGRRVAGACVMPVVLAGAGRSVDVEWIGADLGRWCGAMGQPPLRPSPGSGAPAAASVVYQVATLAAGCAARPQRPAPPIAANPPITFMGHSCGWERSAARHGPRTYLPSSPWCGGRRRVHAHAVALRPRDTIYGERCIRRSSVERSLGLSNGEARASPLL